MEGGLIKENVAMWRIDFDGITDTNLYLIYPLFSGILCWWIAPEIWSDMSVITGTQEYMLYYIVSFIVFSFYVLMRGLILLFGLMGSLIIFRRTPNMLLTMVVSQSIGMIFVFAGIYSITGLQIDGELNQVHHWDALYFSVVTWTTLGYGDFQPIGYARGVASIEALFGYLHLGIIVGLIVALVGHNTGDD